MAWTEVDSFHITEGSVVSGAITDTYTDNAQRHVLSETQTVQPSMMYEYWFASIPGTVTHVRLDINGYYAGGAGHIVEFEIWNYTTSSWDIAGTMLNESGDLDYSSPDLIADDYISGGELKVLFDHPAKGINSHQLLIDKLVLVDVSSSYSTAPPTTIVGTTATPTTPVPTTVLTTAVPTTAWGVDIVAGPIDIVLSSYHILHYWPPNPVNAALDQEADWGPIDIVLDVIGFNKDMAPPSGSIPIEVTLNYGGVNLGRAITAGSIDIVVTLKDVDVDIYRERCNFVKWSKIGELDFTIDESNIAGERPVDWKGCIYHIRKLGDRIVAYGENGATFFKPSGVHFGMDTFYRIGLKNKGAFAGTDLQHFFVDVLGQLFQVDSKFTKLDYSEFLSTMGTVILTLDTEKNLLYICDGSKGYIYGIDSKSFGEGPANITGIGTQSNVLYVVSKNAIVTPKFEICTDIYDLGTRNPKTIREIEVGSNMTEFLYASVDYRNSYKDDFKQIGWHLVNPDGRAHPRCYGSEFRFRFKSTVYEYFEIDYLKIKGHVHSWQGFTSDERDLSAG